MKKKLTIYRIFIYSLLVLILGEIITFVVLVSTIAMKNLQVVSIVFAISLALEIFLWSFLVIQASEVKALIRQRDSDNAYYLGEKFDFNSYAIFEREVKRQAKKCKDRESFIISFTTCSQETTSNLIRNDAVIKFNYLIAKMIQEYFSSLDKNSYFAVNYCFSLGCFIIFYSGKEADVNRLIREFETMIYDIAKENEIRIFVQPFFGIASYRYDQSLGINVEDASLARSNSEKNFELSTYFSNDLQYKVNLEESQEIVEAMENKEFVVFYQPKYNLESKKFISSEALIRWDSKKYGLLSPVSFIVKAEAAGLIHDIDMYVFKRVCEDINEFKRRGKRIIPVSVNFSLYEFYSPNFVEDIVRIMDENNIPHNLIEIEITETTSQSNPFLSIAIMKKIREKGIRILMDDFGVGFSNFNNLRKMPIDSLKIDKSFIDDLVGDNKTREIVRFLIVLAKTNGLEAIAEGVDNIQQVEILKKLKLDTIQGYYYSRPLPKKEYEAFLANNQFEVKEIKGGSKL